MSPTMNLLRRTQVLAGLFVALAAPALAVTGDELSAPTTFDTSFTPRYEVGGYPGILKISIAPDGVVSGYYRNQDVGSFVPVTGGLDGDRIHLDFDFRGRAHIVGTYDGRIIAGGTLVDGRIYNFVASPQTN